MWERVVLVAGLVVTGACGGDDDAAEVSPTTSDVTATTTDIASTTPPSTSAETPAPSASPTDAAESEGELPDPCALVPDEVLAGALGAAPGAGELMAQVPDQRQVCFYPDGTILAVEVAANWEGSLGAIREATGDESLVPVEGIGDEAYWQFVAGVAGQLLVKSGDVFVGVSAAGAGQPAMTTIGETMLAGF